MKISMLKVTVEALVPVDAKDAIRQAVITQAMQAAGQHLIEAAETRDGRATMTAQIVKVEQPEPQLPIPEPQSVDVTV